MFFVSTICEMSLLNRVGGVGSVGAWVREYGGGVGHILAWLAWVHKILAWVKKAVWVNVLQLNHTLQKTLRLL